MLDYESIAAVTSDKFVEFVKDELGSREIVDFADKKTYDNFYLVIETGLAIFEFYYKYDGVFITTGEKYTKSSVGKAALSLLGYKK